MRNFFILRLDQQFDQRFFFLEKYGKFFSGKNVSVLGLGLKIVSDSPYIHHSGHSLLYKFPVRLYLSIMETLENSI